MLKYVPLVVVMAAALTACGGSDSKKKSSSSSSVAVSSSAPASSTPASSTPASSKPASSTPTESSTPASSAAAVSSTPASSAAASSASSSNVITVDLTTVRGNSGATLTLNTDGASLVATADGQGAAFDVLKPTTLEGSVLDFVVNVSNEFKTSGAGLQIFAQLKEDWSTGEWNCAIETASLIANQDVTLSCTIDEGGKFNQTARDVQMGIQAKGTTFAGTVLIKSIKITPAK